MRSTRHDTTTKSDSLARGDGPLDHEVDLTRDVEALGLEVYRVREDWRDVPELPKGVQAGSKNCYRNTR